jgi:hypothetical protein
MAPGAGVRPLPAPRLTLHEKKASRVNFKRMIRGRRTLFWCDAHDGVHEEILRPVLVDRVFPVLRRVPHLFAMHDISQIDAANVPVNQPHRGPCQTPDGRWWMGYAEVHPLAEWGTAARTAPNKPDAILRSHGVDVEYTSIVFFRVP